MKLLLYSWGSNNDGVLKKNLIALGIEVVDFKQKCSHYTRDMELASNMILKIRECSAEGVISFNYIPIVSMICETLKIPYYSWVYDCPHFTLYAGSINSPVNRVGIFDSTMVENLKSYGVSNAFYLPLAVDADIFDERIQRATSQEKHKYGADVSFVGSLYSDVHDYYSSIFDVKDREKVDSIILKQTFEYEKDYIQESIESGELPIDQAVSKMAELGLSLGEEYFADPLDIFIPSVFDKHITVEERYSLMKKLSESSNQFIFKLYTGSKTDIENYGRIDYYKEMPLVFANSKINLNVSLRSIKGGIPLRVLDIMACGGFVMTTPNDEIVNLLEDGKEIVIFNGIEDCISKVKYYLENEDERLEIAQNGLEAVKERFSYRKMLSKLLTDE